MQFKPLQTFLSLNPISYKGTGGKRPQIEINAITGGATIAFAK